VLYEIQEKQIDLSIDLNLLILKMIIVSSSILREYVASSRIQILSQTEE
jgi:hypothetical protein